MMIKMQNLKVFEKIQFFHGWGERYLNGEGVALSEKNTCFFEDFSRYRGFRFRQDP